MSNPFFSIIIPVYNGLAHDLPICLQSIWHQPLEPSIYEVNKYFPCLIDLRKLWHK